MKIKVIIECLAGSDQKNVFDEVTLEDKESFKVSRTYPFPYGFIQGTKSGDGDCLDCFVITNKNLKVKDEVEVEVMGMFEQFETRDGIRKEDHNILAKFTDEDVEMTEDIKNTLTDFILHMWDHRMGKKVEVGEFYDQEEAIELIRSSAASTPPST